MEIIFHPISIMMLSIIILNVGFWYYSTKHGYSTFERNKTSTVTKYVLPFKHSIPVYLGITVIILLIALSLYRGIDMQNHTNDSKDESRHTEIIKLE